MSRGVCYIVWKGTADPTAGLIRSIKSLKHWHPELPYAIREMPQGSNLLVKSQMLDVSPYDETLFLDADTTVMGRLDYGFIKAEQHGIACCINANPWNCRYYKIEQHPDEVEYSSGVVFFDKNWQRYQRFGTHSDGVRAVFKRWNELNETCDTRSKYESAEGIKEQVYNDQALFTRAMHELEFNPFVLPLNWNIYPKWQKHFWGAVKIMHGYFNVPAALPAWNDEQSKPDAVIKCVAWPEEAE